MSDAMAAAAELVRAQRFGVLATHSLAVPGYPFGSVVPYVVGHDGALAILISRLALHTKNIEADARVSLTVSDAAAAVDPQAGARLTWLADARRVDSAGPIGQRYRRYFPGSAGYDSRLDFDYYVLEMVRARYIGGFGDVRWLDRRALDLSNPLGAAEEEFIGRMNSEHAPMLLRCCRWVSGSDVARAVMVGVDPGGCDLLVDDGSVRIAFPAPVDSADAACAALLSLAGRGGS